MITIKCDKCGKESDNHFEFDCARFSYLDAGDTLHFIHLCTTCQKELQIVEDKAFAKFLGEDKIRDWDRHNGIN